MNHTRREFMKDAAVAGVALSAGAATGAEKAVSDEPKDSGDVVRCPYFDQPMYCKGLTGDGKPLCDK
ncbi:MAG: twin-arginine translocation signal domain-containing protein [Candidatus Latescibacterota bacterium]